MYPRDKSLLVKCPLCLVFVLIFFRSFFFFFLSLLSFSSFCVASQDLEGVLGSLHGERGLRAQAEADLDLASEGLSRERGLRRQLEEKVLHGAAELEEVRTTTLA